jgi:hypothetical protein
MTVIMIRNQTTVFDPETIKRLDPFWTAQRRASVWRSRHAIEAIRTGGELRGND